MRVEVDRDLCDGHGLCEGVAPELFELDDDGVLQVRMTHVPNHLRPHAELAAETCPKLAITVLG